MSLAYSVDSGNESYFQTSLQTASSYPQLDRSLSWWGDPGNTITAAPTDALKRPSDFVAVLAVAQKLRIDFLPLAWQPGVAHIGLGGTAKVHQANMNAETCFAFKTFKQAQWMENIGETERPQRCRRAFHTLINEISILGHPSVRGHPAIMKLEGLTWEIMPSGQVWPVLVLDRAQYGDMKCFALSDTGRSMTLSARLELCASIGIGIQHLHNLSMCNSNIVSSGTSRPLTLRSFRYHPRRHQTAKHLDFQQYLNEVCHENNRLWILHHVRRKWHSYAKILPMGSS
jgi:hypothetical protein